MMSFVKHAAIVAAVFAAGGARAALPAGYQFVEYIEATADGGQYIDTGYTLTGDCGVYADIQLMTRSADTLYVFSCLSGGSRGMNTGNGTWNYTWNAGNDAIKNSGSLGTTDTARHVLALNFYQSGLAIIDEDPARSAALTAVSGNSQFSPYIGAGHFYGSIYGQQPLRIYGFRISSNAMTLGADFRPATDANGVACLYDMVRNKTYYSKSAAAYVAGPVIGYADGLLIDGMPDRLGTVSPAYGVQHPAEDATVVCTAPVAWTNADCSVRAECLGWRLEKADGTVTEGSEHEKEIVFTSDMVGAKLIWRWKREFRGSEPATYTWTGAGDGTTWSSAANWSESAGATGWKWGWPGGTGCTAFFPEGTTANVSFDRTVSFDTLVVSNRNLNLVFTAEDGVAVTCMAVNAGDTKTVKTRHGGRIVFDGVKMHVISVTKDFRPNPGNDFILTGGSELNVNKALLCIGEDDSTVYTQTTLGVEDGSHLIVRNLLQVGGDGTLAISNATVSAATVYVNGVKNSGWGSGGAGVIRFYGETPRLEVSTKMVSESANYTGGLGADVEFFVPEGGYAEAPIQYAGTTKFMLKPTAGSMTPTRFIVHAWSPILATDETGAWPFVACANATIDPAGVNLITSVSEVTEALTLSAETNGMTYARYAPASCLKITGAPREFGTGGYGVRRGLANGATETLTAPESDSGNLTCSGYRIYDVATDGTRTLVSSGSGTSCSYEHGTTRREVVWQWSRPDVYVTTTGAGEKTGADWENAYDSIQAGIDKYDYSVVHVATGTYQTTTTTTIPAGKGVEVRGEGTDPSQVVLKKTVESTRVLSIAAALSTVTNITVTNGDQYLPGGVTMSDGLFTGCIVTHCSTTYNSTDPAGILISGGTVSGCVISNNFNWGGLGTGGGVKITGGLVEKCRIISNSTGSYGGGVYMNGGTLRGCLITKCSGGGGYALYVNYGVAVENNTIVANTSTSSSGYGVVVDRRCAFRNNIVYGNTSTIGTANIDVNFLGESSGNCTVPGLVYGEGNIGDVPLFEDYDAGDYRLQFCPCVNGALRRSWMDAVFDMDGLPRVAGSAPDIGCFERAASTNLVCSFSTENSGTPDLANVTLTSLVDGDTEGLVYYWRVIRADGTVYTRTGAAEANPVFQLGAGVYSVELSVTNGAGRSASSSVENATKVTASVVYVNENGSDECPYATREKGAHDFETAYDLLAADGTVYLAPGTYVIANPLRLNNGGPARIISLEGPVATVIRAGNAAPFTANSQMIVEMSKASARIEGVTLAGGAKGPFYDGTGYGIYGGVLLSAGVVTNCVLRDISIGYYNSDISMLKMSGGEAYDLTVTGCRNLSISGVPPEGVAVNISGGTLDRVAVSNCWTYGDGWGGKGGIFSVKGGNVRNALIVGNKASLTAPVYISAGKLENATIVCNTNAVTAANKEYTGGLLVGGGTARNLILSQNWSAKIAAVSNLTGSVTYTLTDDREVLEGEGNKTGDPCFKQGEGRAWHLRSASPAVNAGLRLDWMTETSVDLDGKPRIRNRKPDLGCYECDTTGLTLIVR